ncbi:mechanosensitive ion channel family protein [Candidatus Finniella inopinata]|uniref:Mechanosensitive ion channel n=1 Tax=Candidatus Finniella inopinata TaxID=1696036 RepID=A0A4Q7DK46_9PROT|nr:mechanosensitive ion channel domain-containing protein [Candidatus Finniella inopinata]RZI46669.1 mechanosensitive ion channel [Candidatus Finniella inopinata]
MKLLKISIILLFAFLNINLLHAEEKAAQGPALSPQDIIIGSAVRDNGHQTKQETEAQATNAIASAEALKLLEILENPEKRQKAIDSLKRKGTIASSPKAEAPEDWWESAYHWVKRDNIIFALKAALKILVILIIYVILRRLVNQLITYYTQRIPLLNQDKHSQSTTVAVIKTAAPIIRSTVHWVLIILAALLILSELNINIMPIIYSFSVIGLAISIGSQTLVKDLINGVMMLFEGNMAVGDVVTIGAFKGEVESISLRCVHLRYPTGELQTIPFSEVNYVINHSRDYALANVEFCVSFQADLKQVEDALQAAYETIKGDKQYSVLIKGDIKKLGVSHMDSWNVTVHAAVRITPDPYKIFLNEFYRLLIPELQKRHIPMPMIPFAPALEGS